MNELWNFTGFDVSNLNGLGNQRFTDLYFYQTGYFKNEEFNSKLMIKLPLDSVYV